MSMSDYDCGYHDGWAAAGERIAAAIEAHPPTYTEHAHDPQTFYCPPCSEAIGDWVTWTPEHVVAAARSVTADDNGEGTT